MAEPSRMGAPGSWAPGEQPFPWKPRMAMNFFDVANLIDVYLDPEVPISREMILLFMFHETRFSNIRQVLQSGQPGPGIGLAQIEVMNSDKPEFFRSVFEIDPGPELIQRMLDDERFCIEVQCAYYKHKWKRGAKSLRGLVDAQVGGQTQNQPLIQHFMTAEPMLRNSIAGSNRKAIIDALNECSYVVDPKSPTGISHKPVLLSRYGRYWDFTLPVQELMWGLRK